MFSENARDGNGGKSGERYTVEIQDGRREKE